MPDATSRSRAPSSTPNKPPVLHSVKETLTSIVISFIMAFVFRGFVIEGFQIPTGSMAPTLLGQHLDLRGPESGYAFTAGPWDYVRGTQSPMPVQGQSTALEPRDPITRETWPVRDEPLRSGDRVFVLKYLPTLVEPARWDVSVFKNPSTRENYIKRLIGMPGEQLALVAGDVFTRPITDAERASPDAPSPTPRLGLEAWAASDWSIQRKPERVQRAMFQLMFDSLYTPPSAAGLGSTYRPPWTGKGDWDGVGSSVSYTKAGGAPARLEWRTDLAPITDRTPYNQGSERLGNDTAFPVSDVAASFSIKPETGADAIRIVAELDANGTRFEAELTGEDVVLRKRPIRPEGQLGEDQWTELDRVTLEDAIPSGRATQVEFWHADQAVWLFLDGELIAGGPEAGAYELSPYQRIARATGSEPEDLFSNPSNIPGPVSEPSIYEPTEFAWSFEGGPFTLHRVALARDIHYQIKPGKRTRGAHPFLASIMRDRHYFMCGDNSPNSKDSRLWTSLRDSGDPLWGSAPDPWLADQIDDAVGVVHRDLMVGKAFVVYFPAPHPLPFKNRPMNIIPNLGDVRWIW